MGNKLTPAEQKRLERNQRQLDRINFADQLRNSGHTCVIELETYPIIVEWCNQERCKNAVINYDLDNRRELGLPLPPINILTTPSSIIVLQ